MIILLGNEMSFIALLRHNLRLYILEIKRLNIIVLVLIEINPTGTTLNECSIIKNCDALTIDQHIIIITGR